jgi:hypothetical protein
LSISCESIPGDYFLAGSIDTFFGLYLLNFIGEIA